MEQESNACLGCGSITRVKDRRVLANTPLVPVWEQLLDASLNRAGKDTNSIDRLSLLGDGKSKASGCICRRCFTAMQSYSLKQCELSRSMDNALAKMPVKTSQPIQVGQKRTAVEDATSPAKRVRLSAGYPSRTQLRPRSMFSFSAQSQSQQQASPGVSVSICCFSCIIPVVCTENDPSIFFAGHHWLQSFENNLLDTIQEEVRKVDCKR